MLKTSIRIVSVAILLAAASDDSRACCVGGSGPLAERVKASGAVFYGTVETVDCFEWYVNPVDQKTRCDIQEATFYVMRAWTPGVRRAATVSSTVGTSVSYEFRVGYSYVVFASERQENGRLSTGLCSGTTFAEGGDPLIHELDSAAEGYSPE